MSNLSVRLDPGFVVTPEAEEVYRQVRRYYAESDMMNVCEERRIFLEGEAFQHAVDRYDTWQGDNTSWFDAAAEIAEEVYSTFADGDVGEGILVSGVLQDWDLYDNRVDMWEAKFRIPAWEAARLTKQQLESLLENSVSQYCDEYSVLCRLIRDAYFRGDFAAKCRWEWGDPYCLSVDEDDVTFYLDRLESR